jgi:hypothetical protein
MRAASSGLVLEVAAMAHLLFAARAVDIFENSSATRKDVRADFAIGGQGVGDYIALGVMGATVFGHRADLTAQANP